MEAALKRELDTTSLRPFGHGGGGGISEGQSFQTDAGTVFVKINHKSQARRMFDGELAGLDAILKTKTVKVPKPVKVIDLPDGGSTLVMEYLDMSSISKYMPDLGEQLADLHLSNAKLRESQNKEAQTVGKGAGQSEIQYIDKFGFHVVTCCGYLPQINDWQSDWVTFFARQRLETQLDMIEKEYGDRESKELWSKLQNSTINAT
uniref:protein-ribulosamine 3-kinase n=1 Tax=Callorhinchus milii TaxID=7868 RepID=V9KNS5_CALMI